MLKGRKGWRRERQETSPRTEGCPAPRSPQPLPPCRRGRGMPPTAGAVPWPRALPDAENVASPSLAPVAAASASPGWSLTRSPGSGRCRLPALDVGVRASCRETDTAG